MDFLGKKRNVRIVHRKSFTSDSLYLSAQLNFFSGGQCTRCPAPTPSTYALKHLPPLSQPLNKHFCMVNTKKFCHFFTFIFGDAGINITFRRTTLQMVWSCLLWITTIKWFIHSTRPQAEPNCWLCVLCRHLKTVISWIKLQIVNVLVSNQLHRVPPTEQPFILDEKEIPTVVNRRHEQRIVSTWLNVSCVTRRLTWIFLCDERYQVKRPFRWKSHWPFHKSPSKGQQRQRLCMCVCQI